MRIRLIGLSLMAAIGVVGVGTLPPLLGANGALAQGASQETQGAIAPLQLNGRWSPDSQVMKTDGSYFNEHQFEGKAGQVITIELVSDTFDTYLILLDPNGERIAANDDGRNGTNGLVTVTFRCLERTRF